MNAQDVEVHRAQLRSGILQHAVKLDERLNFDFRLLLTQARHARSAGLLMWHMIKAKNPQVLVGPGFGAMPLIYAIARTALDEGVVLDVLMVRDKRKTYNQKKWVEGHRPQPGARALVIDDFMSGGSVLDLVEKALAAEEIALDIRAIAVFFDMWEPLGSRQLQLHRLPVLRLFSRHDLGLSRDCHDATPPLMQGNAPALVEQALWWRLGLNKPNGYPYRSVPAVADQAIFVADDQSRITRHNALTGDIEWVRDSLAQPSKAIVQQLTLEDDSLVYGCYDGTLTRLNLETGQIIWRWRLDTSIHATPGLDKSSNRLYVNTEQWNEGQPFGHLMALDWHSGRIVWKHAHSWWPPGSPQLDPLHQTVVATCNDQSLTACCAATGRLLWQQPTLGLVRGRPLVTQHRVLVATEKGWLQTFDLQSGEPGWARRYGQGLAHQFLTACDQGVMVMDGKWHWSCFDIDTGELRWITRLRSPGCWQPVRCGRYGIALSRQGHLAVMDLSQQHKVWEGQIRGHYEQPPAVGQVTDAQGRTRHLLAAASNNAGLQVFEINPFYTAA